MNDRIEELAQCNERILNFFQTGPIQRAAIEEFAELIVQECANVVSAGISNATDWDSSYWDQACENRAQAIKKHFGVEE